MAKQVRLLVGEDGGEPAILWAAPRDGGEAFDLLYPYPDFRPHPGWRVRGRGVSGTVKARQGQTLVLEPA